MAGSRVRETAARIVSTRLRRISTYRPSFRVSSVSGFQGRSCLGRLLERSDFAPAVRVDEAHDVRAIGPIDPDDDGFVSGVGGAFGLAAEIVLAIHDSLDYAE